MARRRDRGPPQGLRDRRNKASGRVGTLPGGKRGSDIRSPLDEFIARQKSALAEFDKKQKRTPQQEANIRSQIQGGQSNLNADLLNSLFAEATAGQQNELRGLALGQITDGAPSRSSLDFTDLRAGIEGDRLARRGLFADQRQFIEDILAEQQNLTAGQKDLIGQLANQSIELGRGDIETNLRDTLEILREELAPARGLRPTDSPIIDRGGRLATESLRLGERLSSQVRSGETAALLDLPRSQREFQFQANEQLAQLIAQESGMDIDSARQLADLQAQEEQSKQFASGLDFNRSQLRTSQIQAQQGFGQSLAEFQNRLKSEDFNRRLAETNLVSNLGLNLSGISPSGVGFNVGQESSGTQTGAGTGGQIISSFAGGVGQGAAPLIF